MVGLAPVTQVMAMIDGLVDASLLKKGADPTDVDARWEVVMQLHDQAREWSDMAIQTITSPTGKVIDVASLELSCDVSDLQLIAV